MPTKVVVKDGKKKVIHLPYPSAKAGGYRAPVDTVGMDEEMKKTLGIVRPKPSAKGKKGK